MNAALHPLKEKREAAALAIERGLSQRRACQILQINRSTARYQGQQNDDADLVQQIQKVHSKKARYGIRRVTARLKRQGQIVNHKRVQRVMKVYSLQIRRTKKRKTIRTGASVPQPALYPNHTWCLDFQQDALLNGTKLWILNVLDEFTREWLAVHVGRSTSAKLVMGLLLPLFGKRGVPAVLRSDNGGEFIADDLKLLLKGMGALPFFIEPGHPWENGFIESFHGKVRDEFLNRETFVSVREAGVSMEGHRQVYNLDREHSSLGYLTPVEFREAWEQERDPQARKQREEREEKENAVAASPRLEVSFFEGEVPVPERAGETLPTGRSQDEAEKIRSGQRD